MPKCPNCKSKINFSKVAFGRLQKKGCPYCGVRLRTNSTNILLSSVIIGFVSGAIGIQIGFILRKNDFSSHSIIIALMWFVLSIVFASLISYVFIRYEVLK